MEDGWAATGARKLKGGRKREGNAGRDKSQPTMAL